MRPSRTAAVAAAILLACASRLAPAQTEMEIRAASTEYRFIELSHSFESGLLLDTLYTGEPGMDEVLLGLGYDLSSSERTAVIPTLYAVFGRQYGERGATLGALVYVEHPKSRFLCFLGHFFPIRGDIPGYTFIDTLDLTRVVGRWEIGASAAAYEFEGDVIRVAGPVLKWNDRQGAWAASARFGDDSEFRVLRTLAF